MGAGMRTVPILFGSMFLAVGLSAADNASVSRMTLAPSKVSTLIRELGSELFAERQSAFVALREQDDSALPELEAAIKDSDDPEVRHAARKAIVAIREREIRGEYLQRSLKV